MATKRDLQNAKRLNRIQAAVVRREARNAPEAKETALVSIPADEPVRVVITSKFAGSVDPLASQGVRSSGSDFAAIVEAGKLLRVVAPAEVAPVVIVEEPVIPTPAAYQVIEGAPPVPEAVLVRVYLKPRNPRMRLIELEDGTHGRLWLKPSAHPMIGWMVWAKPQAGSPGDFDLHGRYNGRGTRKA